MTITHHPTSDRIRAVANAFEHLAHAASHRREPERYVIDMANPELEWSESLGACGCHGSWFAVAHLYLENADGDIDQAASDASTDKTGYREGATHLAVTLGFDAEDDPIGAISQYYREHAKIWGNRDGWKMFQNASAFGVTAKALTLDVLAEHWSKVADNTESAERTEVSSRARPPTVKT